MNFLEAVVIYIKCLLKISSEMAIGLILLAAIMITVRLIKKDRCYFTKKLRRYFYGTDYRHCK